MRARTTSSRLGEAVDANPGALVGQRGDRTRRSPGACGRRAAAWSGGAAASACCTTGRRRRSCRKRRFRPTGCSEWGRTCRSRSSTASACPTPTRFPMAWGDLDFSLRAKHAGIPVLVAPQARLFHEVGDYDARVAGAPTARQYAAWLADPKHNLSLVGARGDLETPRAEAALADLPGAENDRAPAELRAHPVSFPLFTFKEILFGRLPMSTRLPSISLVTPSLNQGKFIRATIESVLSQDYPDLDYRVQDGGSTDGTLAVLREYEGRVPFVSEKDAGQADAINKGLSRATGEVLGYLNSDDVLRPGRARGRGRGVRVRPGSRLRLGPGGLHRRGGEHGRRRTSRGPDAIERLADACFIAQPAAFFRRRVWEEVGPFDASLHHTMDYDYWLRIAARYPASRTSLPRPRARGLPDARGREDRGGLGPRAGRDHGSREAPHGLRLALVVRREVGPPARRAQPGDRSASRAVARLSARAPRVPAAESPARSGRGAFRVCRAHLRRRALAPGPL